MSQYRSRTRRNKGWAPLNFRGPTLVRLLVQGFPKPPEEMLLDETIDIETPNRTKLLSGLTNLT